MYWIVLSIGMVVSSIVGIIAYKKNSKKIKIIAFVISLGFTFAFWILLYNSGFTPISYDTIQDGRETGFNPDATKGIIALFTSGIVGFITLGISFLLSKIKFKKKNEQNAK